MQKKEFEKSSVLCFADVEKYGDIFIFNEKLKLKAILISGWDLFHLLLIIGWYGFQAIPV